jgi:hypothetical protein
MSDEFSHGPVERPFTEQDEFGETLLFDGSDPAFGKRIRVSLQMRRIATLRTDLSV